MGGAVNLEGRIDIRVTRHGALPVTVAIHSTRPQLAQKLLAGRPPGEAVKLAGLIFSLCGKAQRVAAAAACGAAAGTSPDAAGRDGVFMELAQEHAWRLLVDWPQQVGIAPDMDSLLRLRQGAGDPVTFAAALEALLQDTLLGEPVADWLARDLAGFDAWRAAGATATARLFAGLGQGADMGISRTALLPPLWNLDDTTVRELAHFALDTPAFCAQPVWQGEPAETGAIARMHDQPLLAAWMTQRGRGAGARLLARLLDLASSAGAPAGSFANLAGEGVGATGLLVRAWPLGDNGGLAGVETSRGLLLHAVRLRGGKVAEYRIVAPTEWNFHPEGPLFQALTGAATDTAAARLIAQSLDPCVAFAIEVEDA